jgi:hypothetical protein
MTESAPRLSFDGDRQTAWDSTSLTTFLDCPRKYYYRIVCGYATREQSVHLTFGINLHSAIEAYHHAQAQGLDYQPSLRAAVRKALRDCAGWHSDDPHKNPETLIRTVVWYLDSVARSDTATTLILANGKPAVELSFRFELPSGHLYCGHLDRVADFGDQSYVFDMKSTKRALYPEYFAQFSPHNQMSGYAVAGKIALARPVAGVVIDAAQVGVTFSRFARGMAARPPGVLDEWLDQTAQWIRLAGRYADGPEGAWPMNLSSCDKFFGCEFRGVCSKSPAQRKSWLEADFVHRLWDPLQIRGDI